MFWKSKCKSEEELDNGTSIKAPDSLIKKAHQIYSQLREMPLDKTISISTILPLLEIFSQLLEHTGKIIDQYEYDRRLLQTGAKTTKGLASDTLEWLKSLDSFDAGRGSDIAHNLYYILQLQTFSEGVEATFKEAEKVCDEFNVK